MFRSAKLLSAATRLRVHRRRRKTSQRGRAYHRLRHEPLEDRRVLSAVTVTNDLDLVNGDTSSIANLIASDGGDGIALREAIEAANATLGADDIVFDFGHDGPAVILLELGELEITDALTITGDGPDLLTIDAQGTSRVMLIANNATVNVNGLTLTGGSADRGAGLRNSAGSTTTISATTISGNTATLTDVDDAGGGIWNAGVLTVSDSVITDNTALNIRAGGGGVWNSNSLSVYRSTISANSSWYGGGVRSAIGGDVRITDSTIVDNMAIIRGGGISAEGVLSIKGSTISGNTAHSQGGGGVHSAATSTTISHSTITGNSAGFGGVPINVAKHGGGIVHYSNVHTVQLDHTIVANNVVNGSGRDIFASTVATSSLIGNNAGSGLAEAPLGSPDGDGNLIGGYVNGIIDPLLGPLADNGGPTMTHALLPGSPAIDAGDPAFVGPPLTDQRGYYRVVDGDGDMTARVDMGAYEYASVPPLSGDGNLDGTVDGLDYLLWASHYGDNPAMDPPGVPLNGDYNDDGLVDGLDYVVWAINYGTSLPVVSAALTIERLSTATDDRLAAVDATFAEGDDTFVEEGDANVTIADRTLTRHWRWRVAFDATIDELSATRKNPRHRRR